ncbi:MAG: M16 family metallopeptidase [Nitrospinota bacterium]
MKKGTLLVAILSLSFFLSLPARAATFKTELENGLTVILKENHLAPIVTLHLFVRTGSIYEGEYLGSGVSHVLEHLVHGGTTKRRSEREGNLLLARMGNRSNAYTTRDHTGYYISTTREHLESALDLLVDWVLNSAFTEEEWRRELGVVKREMEQNQDDPARVLTRLAAENLFKVHPARIPVIGYREVLDGLTREKVMEYYRRTYVPNNMVLVAVGDFEREALLEKIKSTLRPFKRGTLPFVSLPAEPAQAGKREMTREMEVSTAYLDISFRTIPLTHPDLYPLDILSFIMSQGESSRLVREVREKGLASSITSWSFTPGYGPGTFTVRATVEPGKLEAARGAILRELYRLKRELVGEAELRRAKRQKVSEHVLGAQTVEAQARELGINMLSAFDPDFGEKYVEKIQLVGREALREVAQRYFREDNLSVTILKPKAKGRAAEARAKPHARKLSRHRLPNGMTLLLKRNPAVPAVALHVYFRGGVRAEPQGKNGLSNLMAQMLLRGTKSKSARELARAFDEMGARVETGSGRNTFFLTAEFLKGDLGRVLGLLSDIIMNPSFPEEELRKLKPILLAQLRRRKDNWQSELSDLFYRHFFRKSPYRFLPLGKEEDLTGIAREDLIQFHQKYVAPNNMVLAIFGDIEPEATKEEVERAFKGFEPKGELSFPRVLPEPPLKESRELRLPSTKRVSALFLGFSGVSIYDLEDRLTLDVIDALTSGINYPSGWLHRELRGKKLVYFIHAFNWTGLEPGYFGVMAATEPEKTQEVTSIILKNLRRLSEEAISQEELREAKNIVKTAWMLNRQTNGELASEAALNELYGLGQDFEKRYLEGIERVTGEDIKRVARKYLGNYFLLVTSPSP